MLSIPVTLASISNVCHYVSTLREYAKKKKCRVQGGGTAYIMREMDKINYCRSNNTSYG